MKKESVRFIRDLIENGKWDNVFLGLEGSLNGDQAATFSFTPEDVQEAVSLQADSFIPLSFADLSQRHNLFLGDRRGRDIAVERWTVAHSLAWYDALPFECMTKEILSLVSDFGYSVAHLVAKKMTFTSPMPKDLMNEDVLLLSGRRSGLKRSYTVAHLLARKVMLPFTAMSEKVMLARGGCSFTVAHSAAENYLIELPCHVLTESVLEARDNRGWTVAHELANRGTLPEKLFSRSIFSLKTDSGLSVATMLAQRNLLPERYFGESFLLSPDFASNDIPVGVELAVRGFLPPRKITRNLLLQKTEEGQRIAHIFADMGYLPPELLDSELLDLEDDNGNSVLDLLQKKGLCPRTAGEAENLIEIGADNALLAGIFLEKICPKKQAAQRLLFDEAPIPDSFDLPANPEHI